MRLLNKWDSEKCYNDLIIKAITHAPKETHFQKTSLYSRKQPYTSPKLYTGKDRTKCPNCGSEIQIERFSNGRIRVIGSPLIFSPDPLSLMTILTPQNQRLWVEERIKEGRIRYLEELADYINFRLEENRGSKES